MMKKFRFDAKWIVGAVTALCASVALFFPHPTLAAVGLTPSEIVAKDLLSHSVVQRTFFLSRQNPFQDEYALVTVTGTAAGYIKIPNNGTILLPKGINNTPMQFTIEPGSLSSGDYQATITVSPAPAGSTPNGGSSGSSILSGAQGTVRFSVTTKEIEKYRITSPMIRDTEEGQIISFGYTVQNEGNTDVRPTKVEFTATDVSDPKNTYTESFEGDTLRIVKAMSSDSQTLTTKASLGIGAYTGHLLFTLRDGTQQEFKDIRFQILPKGTLAQSGELASLTTNKTSYLPGEAVKLSALFKNTGKIGVLSTMTLEIRQGDKRIDVLSSDSVFVPVGSSYTFGKEYTPADPGAYTAVATVTYGSHTTDAAQVDFTITAPVAKTPSMLIYLVIFVFLIAFILWLILRRRRSTVVNIPPPAPPAAPVAAAVVPPVAPAPVAPPAPPVQPVAPVPTPAPAPAPAPAPVVPPAPAPTAPPTTPPPAPPAAK